MEFLSQGYFDCAFPGCKNSFEQKCDTSGCDNEVCDLHLVRSKNSNFHICVMCSEGEHLVPSDVDKSPITTESSSSTSSSSSSGLQNTSGSSKLILKLVISKSNSSGPSISDYFVPSKISFLIFIS
jgi:hypothetical protein